MKKFFKLLISILFLPFVFFFIYDFLAVLWTIIKNFQITFPFLFGIVIYLILHKYIYNFSRPYVLAHEVCHALAAWCSGYKVTDIKVQEESGQTKVSDVNTFVLLAPYCVPLYALIFTFLFYITSLFWVDILNYEKLFLGLLGFFVMFHLVHTYKSLTETEQSDITLAGGGMFSFVIIAIINLTLIVLFINFLFPGIIAPTSILKEVFMQTYNFWKMFFVYMHKFVVWAGNL
ncbi:MAG: M50 family metallopeptidase [Elusimicrobiaceae bacterium]|nr:M50 family metallopeptidase [Elusimicrobiaceae bacterium]